MTSVFLTRRTLLGSGALMGLGALLAACGQQANNEATATASAAPSETASDSAAASESPSASATPRVTRGYSGNSKAPDGEYRKADEYGPAQNVQEPRKEPAQYPETEQGLYRMMKDWLASHNYAIQTGDMQYVWPYMLDTYEKDIKFLKDIEGLYQRGG
ncbi:MULTISPECIES: DUF6318 family protein [Rothia]|uniref:DUF6318 family protein n=1 Tax=Rothia TaxID=32207 RepID=UPI0028D1449B|nr:DUF6318 family protein [Rothia mucilaginosa]